MSHNTQRILITGGAGYIGSTCVHALLADGYDVTVFDNLTTGQRSMVPREVLFVEGDIRDREALSRVCDAHTYSAVMHLAALKDVVESQQHEALYREVNIDGTATVLDVMARYSVPRIVFSSSAAVYGVGGDVLYTEDMPLAPVHVYGETKRAAEQLIQDAHSSGDIRAAVSLRYFNVAGDALGRTSSHAVGGLFDVIAATIARDGVVSVFGDDYNTPDGTCVRDYVHVADVASAHRDAYTGESGVYNIGSGTGYSVRAVIDAFERILGHPVAFEVAPRRDGDVAYSCADTTQATRELGWKPQYTLDDMVRSSLHRYGL